MLFGAEFAQTRRVHGERDSRADCTAERLLEAGFKPTIVDAVVTVTKRKGESYSEFVERSKANPLDRTVKRADIIDHCDPSRLSLLPADKREQLESKYQESLQRLDEV